MVKISGMALPVMSTLMIRYLKHKIYLQNNIFKCLINLVDKTTEVAPTGTSQ